MSHPPSQSGRHQSGREEYRTSGRAVRENTASASSSSQGTIPRTTITGAAVNASGQGRNAASIPADSLYTHNRGESGREYRTPNEAQPGGSASSPPSASSYPTLASHMDRLALERSGGSAQASESQPRTVPPQQPPDYGSLFHEGRVFIVPWTENDGPDARSNHSASPTLPSERMMVVVRAQAENCIALPIRTYAGRGVSWSEVKKSDHAVIHDSRVRPTMMSSEEPAPGEMPMRNPIAVRVDAGQWIDPKARVDFGKPQTISHQAARSVGVVHPSSRDRLVNQFGTVLDDFARSQGRDPDSSDDDARTARSSRGRRDYPSTSQQSVVNQAKAAIDRFVNQNFSLEDAINRVAPTLAAQMEATLEQATRFLRRQYRLEG